MNIREDIIRVARESVMAIEEAEIPTDLRRSAFERIFDALIGLKPSTSPAERASNEVPTNGVERSLRGIADRLRLDLETVSDVYHLDGDELGIGIAPSRLDPRKAVGTKQIALLVAAGRQAGSWEEWTPVRVIRETARDFGRFDSSNFATTIKDMGDVLNIRGRGRQVEVRVTRPGYERAAHLIGELVAG